MDKTIDIEGMSCNHCKMHVEKALSTVPGVKAVKVDLAKNNAVVSTDETVSNEQLTMAVNEAGYEVTGIH